MSSSTSQVSELQGLVTLYGCVLSAGVLLYYDTVITFTDEVNHIWHRKLSGATLLFLVNRYGNLVFMTMNLLAYFGPQARVVCIVISDINSIFEICALLIPPVFSAFRIWAIWGKKWLPFILVLTIGLVTPIVDLFIDTTYRLGDISPAPPPFGGCMWNSTITWVLADKLATASRASLIACDSIVLLATWMKTYGIKRAANQAGIQPKLINLLIRDGTLYFGTLLIINVLALKLGSIDEGFIPIATYCDVFTCILISRFILNLRTFEIVDQDDSVKSSSGIDFAIGDIGASLNYGDSLFDTSESVVQTTYREKSENPLAVGILGVKDPHIQTQRNIDNEDGEITNDDHLSGAFNIGGSQSVNDIAASTDSEEASNTGEPSNSRHELDGDLELGK